LFSTDGWYTDGGIWGGGDYVNVSQTTVYEGTAYPSTEYANAFINCTTSSIADGGEIYNAINSLDGEGATRTDLGMEMASNIFATQPSGTYSERKKIVVVLTDGVPTTSSSFSDTVANNAIGYAKEMKDDGAEIFALYFGNPSANSVSFMQGMSNNYPDATAYTNLGVQAKTTYYSAHNNAAAITGVFNEIIYSIAANAQLDEKAILQDELTKYFKLPDTIAGDVRDEIRVYTSNKTATGWGEEIPFEDAIIELSADNKTISVSGFDYAYYCVTEESKSQEIVDYGKKLVVYIPIVADETANTIGGYLPTNVHAGVYEDDIAVEIDDAAVTADGHSDDVGIAYMMENDEFFQHIGTDDSFTYTFDSNSTDGDITILPMAQILDEMFLVKPDGVNNTGVRLDYRIYDTNTDQASGADDTLVATLVLEPGDGTDITDISNWDFEAGMDTNTIAIGSGANSASKVYAIVCRAYNVNPAYENDPVYNMTYGLLNITAVNEDVHIVGGVIDDGGTVSVSAGAGNFTYDMDGNAVGYTEEVADGDLTSAMTFALKDGYEFRRIILKTSTLSALDTPVDLYNIDTGVNNVVFVGNNYVYESITADGGQIVEVYTQLKEFNLTTASDEHSLIVDGKSYEYSETEKLAVPFQAKDGYEITSILYGETEADAVEVLGMSDADLDVLGITFESFDTASGYAADGTAEEDLLQGEVLVPRTQDNYVKVTASPRNYKLTYKQYKRVVNNLETTYEPYDTDQTHFVAYNTNIPSAPVAPGVEAEIDGNYYTINGWYRNHPNNEFTGLTDITAMLMPAADMMLHAYWAQNPSIAVSIPVKKIAAGAFTGSATFEIMGTYHEHPVGDITLTVSDSAKTADGTLEMTLTDKQYDSFMQGDVIRITESDETGGNWIYDEAEYTVHYNPSGEPIIKKGEQVVSSADFTNYYNVYTVKYDLAGGTYQGAVSIPDKTVEYDDAELISDAELEKAGSIFTGWKFGNINVTPATTYKELAGSMDVFSVTLVAQYKEKSYTVEYNLNGGNIDGVQNIPAKTVGYSESNLLPSGIAVKEGYTLVGWEYNEATVTNSNTYASLAGSYNVDSITLSAVWEVDVIGGGPDPDEGDNIPDIYQKKITFKILNGTWDGAANADIIKVVNLLDGEGNYSAAGTADITEHIPDVSVAVAAPDHDTPGEWREVPPILVSGTDPVVYVYIFHKTPDVVYDEYEEDKPDPTPQTEEYDLTQKIQVDPNRGVWSFNGQDYTTVQTIEMQDNIDLGEPTRDGYVFMGWLKTDGTGEIVHIYTAQWEKDDIGTTDPDDGDNVADIFQKKIIFKVVNGTWADDTSTDVVYVVNLLDGSGKYSKTGSADITSLIPTGMKANSGYQNGSWDTAPVSPATDTQTVTYTYSYEKTPTGGGGGGGSTKYTLTYESNGGTEYKAEKYNRNTTVDIDKKPTKDGYVFEGWYEDKELTKYVEEVKMAKDITVYAKWVEDNGGTGNGYGTPGSLNGEDHFAYVVGYPDGTVRPNDNISRAEVTAIFFRLLKPDEVRDKNLTTENNFNDVNDGDWHNASISTMEKLGIVKGRYADQFVPDAFITRAEFAAICARFDDSEFEVIDNFTDVAGHWAEHDIHEAAAHGWIRGYEDGTFKPDQFITRAEAMTMINRVLNRVPETADDLLADMINWPDNSDKSAWYYLAVQEATNSHDYEMKNHIYEKWTALREVTDWTKYE